MTQNEKNKFTFSGLFNKSFWVYMEDWSLFCKKKSPKTTEEISEGDYLAKNKLFPLVFVFVFGVLLFVEVRKLLRAGFV